MPPLEEVAVSTRSLAPFEEVLAPEQWRAVQESVRRARVLLEGRTVWNVNSTARGGGVAELLQSLIGYARGAGVDARWIAISGDGPFFTVTKRLHNRLHGSDGDGGALGQAEREAYEAPLQRAAEALVELISRGDLVILHDPQTAGLISPVRETGAHVAWRSHVGHDNPNETALEAWRFLLPYVREADACVFSRPSYAWGGIERDRLAFIHPSIDVFSVKNEELEADAVAGILDVAGLLEGEGGEVPRFKRGDGSTGQVTRSAELLQERPLSPSTPVVLQVSRWDRLKDPAGVMDGFAAHVAPHASAHLVLAGPVTDAVADDPEGAGILAEISERWWSLDEPVRARVHLASVPMHDAEENAAVVNAMQRHATVVCQKSIAEGFGLTVAEAMWKWRPVVASRVGGIQDQIVHGTSGLLVDPLDLRAFASAVRSLLEDPDRAARIGAAAHERTREEFLGPMHLMQYLGLFERLLRDERRHA